MRINIKALVLAVLLAGCSKPAQQAAEQTIDTTAETTVQTTVTTVQTEPETSAEEKTETSNAQEYLDTIRTAFNKYADTMTEHVSRVDSKDYEGARNALEDCFAALREFDNITPPAEYSELNDKLMASVDSERRYLDDLGRLLSAMERMSSLEGHIDSLTDEEKDELVQLASTISEITSSEKKTPDFADTYLETVKTLMTDING